ncbi:hypothetical protein chiPu_0011317 [Chiloscyllium punctatum]|uniref:Uncharacterized protein n=1 Tax=Chiloscyllium punctatum TaxID=137246 RepID=A0A401SR76_CHIPU|nr:hypothetical protein [Chiloscyllium punctatum]
MKGAEDRGIYSYAILDEFSMPKDGWITLTSYSTGERLLSEVFLLTEWNFPDLAFYMANSVRRNFYLQLKPLHGTYMSSITSVGM